MSTAFSGLNSTAVCFDGVSMRILLGVKWDERPLKHAGVKGSTSVSE